MDKVLTRVVRCDHNQYMSNSEAARGNTNTISTVVTRDGAEHIIRHRNTITRAGINMQDVDSARCHSGMPESSRVGA